MGTQFDITEEGLEGLQRLREEDIRLYKPERLEYLVLTLLDLEGLMDYQGLLAETPRSAGQDDVSDTLKSLERKGWITIER